MSDESVPQAVAEAGDDGGSAVSAETKAVEMSPLQRMRHSAAHVMAEAVTEIFPDAKLGIGPPIDNGFYYDFDLPRTLTPDDLAEVERRMAESIGKNQEFVCSPVSLAEAREMFTGQPYKLELVEQFGDGDLTVYRQGEFVDLCRGPHVRSTSELGPFKLTSVSGAYWRGDEHNAMLQRIYGTMWPTQAELDDYLFRVEEAQRRDHRRLGRELDLFSISDKVGPGLVLWHPKGATVRRAIEDFWRDFHERRGYQLVVTPHIGKSDLWETSGHLGFFRENMFSSMEVEDHEYFVKPMNCPFHLEIFGSRTRSYRDLPLRIGEMGMVYRYERSGVLHGLLRVRGFTVDDAHIFCRPDQIEDEILDVIHLAREVLSALGFPEFKAYLATKPDKAVGDDAMWEEATDALRKALVTTGTPFELDPGGGAFYGPKIDIKITDALGREWQCSTIQFDFNEPERFDSFYIGEDNERHRPYMVHRAILGSMERFFAVLIEQFGGAFPTWMAPVQAIVLPIADRHADYAGAVVQRLRDAGIRAEADVRGERLGAKIRDAQMQKVPYMLVAGDKEAEAESASLRLRSGEDLGAVSLAEIVEMIQADVAAKQAQPGKQTAAP
ncbi:MAG TPA: threonine--tRNA ligase [Chloroflexota bacterium]|jgi:threonyl-tRNA synthetase|nr:threonine--tRNA ligase [Chloroflexota bacterium]